MTNNFLTPGTLILTTEGYFEAWVLHEMLQKQPFIMLPSYNLAGYIELDICRKIEKEQTFSNQYHISVNDDILKLHEHHSIYIHNKNYSSISHIGNTVAASLHKDDILFGFDGLFNIEKIVKYTFKQPNFGYRLYTEKNKNFFATRQNILL